MDSIYRYGPKMKPAQIRAKDDLSLIAMPNAERRMTSVDYFWFVDGKIDRRYIDSGFPGKCFTKYKVV